MKGAGASSMTFWLRRCTEQSRVVTTAKLPWTSRMHWVSMWRPEVMNFSMKNLPRSPPAMACPAAKFFTSCSSRMTSMPRPPPPSERLRTIGKPCSAMKASTSAMSETGSTVPGTGSTPAAMATRRALILSPSWLMVSAAGPSQVRPASAMAWAASGTSERKP